MTGAYHKGIEVSKQQHRRRSRPVIKSRSSSQEFVKHTQDHSRPHRELNTRAVGSKTKKQSAVAVRLGRYEATRSQMYEDLRQAVLNTPSPAEGQ